MAAIRENGFKKDVPRRLMVVWFKRKVVEELGTFR